MMNTPAGGPLFGLDPDRDLIQRFHEGDASAFENLFQKYKSLVVNLAFRFVRQGDVAEDIAQDVFLKVYEKKYRVERRAKFSTWLYRVTVNASLDLQRRKKFSGRSLEEEIEDARGRKTSLADQLMDRGSLSPAQTAVQEEIQFLVQREIEQLPEKLRTPILLYQFQEMSYQEIASILGLSGKAVERRLYHAKEKLRKRLTAIL